jgi:hypothetical protein
MVEGAILVGAALVRDNPREMLAATGNVVDEKESPDSKNAGQNRPEDS